MSKSKKLPKRDEIIQRVKEKNPQFDDKLVEHFVTLLENGIHSKYEHQAAYYMNKAIYYARQMKLIQNDSEIAEFYFDDTEAVTQE